MFKKVLLVEDIDSIGIGVATRLNIFKIFKGRKRQ